jgi:hypothetical protein
VLQRPEWHAGRLGTLRGRWGGTRGIVDVIFSFMNQTTDVVKKYSVNVDVIEKFPFLPIRFRRIIRPLIITHWKQRE